MDLFQHQFMSPLCRCKREAHTACIWVPTAHSVEKCRKWVFQIYIIVPTHKIMSIWTLHVILGNAIWPNKLHWKTVSCTYHYANKHIQHTRTNTHTLYNIFTPSLPLTLLFYSGTYSTTDSIHIRTMSKIDWPHKTFSAFSKGVRGDWKECSPLLCDLNFFEMTHLLFDLEMYANGYPRTYELWILNCGEPGPCREFRCHESPFDASKSHNFLQEIWGKPPSQLVPLPLPPCSLEEWLAGNVPWFWSRRWVHWLDSWCCYWWPTQHRPRTPGALSFLFGGMMRHWKWWWNRWPGVYTPFCIN